jgi:hypothetical protein
LILRHVVGAQRPAALQHPLGDPPRHLAAVKQVRTLGAVALERVSQLLEPEDLAGDERSPLRRVDGPALGLMPEDRLEDVEDECLLGVHVDAIAGEARGLTNELAQGHRSVAPQRLREPRGGAGHSARRGADVEDLRRLRAEVDGDRNQLSSALAARAPGNLHEEVEQHVLGARVVYEHEPTGAKPGQGTLGDERGEDRGHRGVHGVSSLPQHPGPGLRGHWMAGRHGAAHGHRDRVSDRERIPGRRC